MGSKTQIQRELLVSTFWSRYIQPCFLLFHRSFAGRIFGRHVQKLCETCICESLLQRLSYPHTLRVRHTLLNSDVHVRRCRGCRGGVRGRGLGDHPRGASCGLHRHDWCSCADSSLLLARHGHETRLRRALGCTGVHGLRGHSAASWHGSGDDGGSGQPGQQWHVVAQALQVDMEGERRKGAVREETDSEEAFAARAARVVHCRETATALQSMQLTIHIWSQCALQTKAAASGGRRQRRQQ